MKILENAVVGDLVSISEYLCGAESFESIGFVCCFIVDGITGLFFFLVLINDFEGISLRGIYLKESTQRYMHFELS